MKVHYLLLLVACASLANGFINHIPKYSIRYRPNSRCLASTKSQNNKNNIDIVDKVLFKNALPSMLSLGIDPVVSMADSIIAGKINPVEQASIGASSGIHYSISKFYNDPLVKSTTSLVAGKKGDELEATISVAMLSALFIGITQTIAYLIFTKYLVFMFGMGPSSELYNSATSYLKWRALGIPAHTLSLVISGIFRGKHNATLPLLFSFIGGVLTIMLDYLFVFDGKLGGAGVGAAASLAQWLCLGPMLFALKREFRAKSFLDLLKFTLDRSNRSLIRDSFWRFINAGSHIFVRTIGKIMAYTFFSVSGTQLGTIGMAAYVTTFNIGINLPQFSDALSLSAQSLIAHQLQAPKNATGDEVMIDEVVKDDLKLDSSLVVPDESNTAKVSIRSIVSRTLGLTNLVTLCMVSIVALVYNPLVRIFSNSPEVFELSRSVFPWVLLTVFLKFYGSAFSGFLLGAHDYRGASLSMALSSIAGISLLVAQRQITLTGIWKAITLFSSVQVSYLFSNTVISISTFGSLLFAFIGPCSSLSDVVQIWSMEIY